MIKSKNFFNGYESHSLNMLKKTNKMGHFVLKKVIEIDKTYNVFTGINEHAC